MLLFLFFLMHHKNLLKSILVFTFLDHMSCIEGVDAALADTNNSSTSFCGQGCREVLLFVQVFSDLLDFSQN